MTTAIRTRVCEMAVTALLAMLGFSGPAVAQSYPDKPVKLVVSLAPGGGVDFFARTIAPKLSEILGQPVVVENKAGGATNIAADAVAHAAPDGYTLLLSSVTTFAINPSLFKNLTYDPVKDFAPVSLSGTFQFLLVSNSAFRPESAAAFISYAKANPKSVSYASAGAGSPHQLAMELLARRAGIEVTHVPYKGAGPAVQDLIAGHIPVMFLDVATALPHIKSGRIRALAAASPQRLQVLPNVPTLSESGVPGFEAASWLGIVAPARTPAPIVAKLNTAINQVLTDPDVRSRIAAAGADTTPGTPQAFRTYQASEIKKWGEIIKRSKITPD
ncbi:tripartite tricarboxylate transporter substrate binding protein [Ramlibacter sp. WS9]|uniref:Bug family tripartite tricarboxylate transporter substrate binding protein n=1 Tax=Ramlibacter sp. WS9 TaxID=1882741 RepID=UPI001305315A|nr:tripartite tricarboxylate transporter substrate binding protein [Ramlibacter sp. WS9]